MAAPDPIDNAAATDSIGPVLRRIESVDVNMDHYPSYAEYCDRVHREIKTGVDQVSSAQQLKALFIECHRRWRTAPVVPQERIQWIEPHAEACDVIPGRLADLGSEEATRILVQLCGDQRYGWDGGFSLDAAYAISRCGPRAIPYLQKTDFGESEYIAQELVRCIQKGKLYGP